MPQPIEIGIVSIWHVRGATMVARQLALALESDVFRTHVCARWESDRFFAGPPVDHPRVTNAGDDPGIDWIVAWAKERRLAAVLFCEVHPNDWKRVEALRAAGVRVYASEVLDLLRLDRISSYGQLDGMVHAAFGTADVFRHLHPNVPGLTLPWGVAPSPRQPPRPVVAQGRPLRFVHVAGWGGLGNRKATDVVLRAWCAAAPQQAHLTVFTQAPLERYGAEVAAAVRRMSTITVQEGTVTSIASAYATADILLAPSRREGLGLPQVEALAAGVPVVVSDGLMMTQWIVPNEHGVVCPATVERDGMYLPLVRVDDEVLAAVITGLAKDLARVAAFREHVARDHAVWTWSWQPEVLRRELRAMIEHPGYAPDPAAGYIPEAVRAFELRRRARG